MVKRPEALIPPITVIAALIVLLIVARNYNSLPIKPPPCSFRTLTGLPCFGCGGTRAFKALSRGDFLQALQYNPAITLAVFGVGIWMLLALIRKDKPYVPLSPEARRKRNILFIIGGILIFISNWIYLALYL